MVLNEIDLDELDKEVERLLHENMERIELNKRTIGLLSKCVDVIDTLDVKKGDLVKIERARDIFSRLISGTFNKLYDLYMKTSILLWCEMVKRCFAKGIEPPVLDVDVLEALEEYMPKDDSPLSKAKRFAFECFEDACKEIEKATLEEECSKCKNRYSWNHIDFCAEAHTKTLICLYDFLIGRAWCKYNIPPSAIIPVLCMGLLKYEFNLLSKK